MCSVETQVGIGMKDRSEEHTSELQSRLHLVCRLLLEKKTLRAAENRAAGAHRTILAQPTVRSGDALQSAASLRLFGGEWNPQVLAGHFFALRNALHS